MTRRWLAIVNATAGQGRAGRRFAALSRALSARDIPLEVAYTTPDRTGTRQAQEAASLFDGLLIVGGDGTVHEVVNGLDLSCPPLLAVAPYGTGNDWARDLHLPDDPERLADLIRQPRLRQMRIGEVRYGPVGQVQQRRFINGVGLGLDAEVLHHLPSRGPRALAYLIGTLRALRRFRARDARIQTSTLIRTGQYLLLYAGLGTHAGGGMRITPHARRQDGTVALTLIPAAPLSRLLSALPALYNGHLDRTAWIDCRHSAEVIFEAAGFTLEADGQLLGAGPATITVRPETLPVVAGSGPEADNGALVVPTGAP